MELAKRGANIQVTKLCIPIGAALRSSFPNR
jgi:hypothetical protein